VRRTLVVLALTAGCGFKAESGQRLDASAPDAPQVWTVMETLEIPTFAASGSPPVVRSQSALAAGREYHLRVSGTFSCTFGGTGGDAEYWDFVALNDLASAIDFGVAIDDATIDGTKTRWGGFAASHVYEVTYVGTGATLGALLHDSQYDNNTGTLTLEILELR